MIPETIVGAAAAGAAAGVFAYGAAAAESQLFGATFFGTPGKSRRLALTYDDGPNDPHTGKLLDVLDRHGVKATFFLIGRYVAQRPEIAREVARRGHVIGNHTFTHPNLIFASQTALERELRQTEEALAQAVGEHSRLFRPPFGARRPATLRRARQLGLETIMWSVKCWDWSAPSAEYIVKKAVRGIRGGDVILLHDGGHAQFGTDRSHTVNATDELLRRYQGEGFEFVTIPQMQNPDIRSLREHAAGLIERYLRNEITNDELEDRWPQSSDRTLWQIWKVLEPYAACLEEHRTDDMHQLTNEQKDAFARAALFLRSDLSYRWPDNPTSVDQSVWPFANTDELTQQRR